MSNWPAGVCHQVMKQVKLLRSQVDVPSLLLHKMPRDIKTDISDHDLDYLPPSALRLRLTAARIRAMELAKLKRLGDVVIGPGVQRFHLAGLRFPAR